MQILDNVIKASEQFIFNGNREKGSNSSGNKGAGGQDSSNPSPVSTWTNWPDHPKRDMQLHLAANANRPNTVNGSMETSATKGKSSRPAVTQLFEALAGQTQLGLGPYGTLKKQPHPHTLPPHPPQHTQPQQANVAKQNQLQQDLAAAAAAAANMRSSVRVHSQVQFNKDSICDDAQALPVHMQGQSFFQQS